MTASANAASVRIILTNEDGGSTKCGSPFEVFMDFIVGLVLGLAAGFAVFRLFYANELALIKRVVSVAKGDYNRVEELISAVVADAKKVL